MKTFRIIYESPQNIFKGELFTTAKDSPEAMDKFFSWLKKQEVWGHLWSFNVKIEETKDAKWI